MRRFCLFCWFLLPLASWAQTPFSVVWSFEDNLSNSVSHPNIIANGPGFGGVNIPTVGSYVGGQVGRAVNVANWSTSGCNLSEHVEFTIQPVSGQTMTLTQLSLYFNRSAAGPAQVLVRSSVDGYAAQLYSQPVTNGFQQATVTLSGGAYTNQSGPISFRITACTNASSGGALRLDEVTINGTVTVTPLPVTLLSFTAKPDGNRVQLAWTTTWERDADRFIVERSSDLTEFTPIGTVLAKGTTNQRQDYGLTDPNPRPGTNYYRLKQRDFDGTTTLFKPVSAIVRAEEPAISVYPNPADARQIHLRLWNADNATVRLLTLLGQSVSGQLDRTPGEAIFSPTQPLPAGLYFLEVTLAGQRQVIRTLVR